MVAIGDWVAVVRKVKAGSEYLCKPLTMVALVVAAVRST